MIYLVARLDNIDRILDRIDRQIETLTAIIDDAGLDPCIRDTARFHLAEQRFIREETVLIADLLEILNECAMDRPHSATSGAGHVCACSGVGEGCEACKCQHGEVGR